MSAAAETTGPQRKGSDTPTRILDAAEHLFGERGYTGTTLRDVAACVGLRTPSLYNHFPSKDDLYVAVLERGVGPPLQALSEYVQRGGEADPRALLERIVGLLAERPDLPRLVLHEILAGGRHLTPMLRTWIAPTFERGREVLASTAVATRWDPEQVPFLLLALYNAVVGYFAMAPLYRQLSGPDLLTAENLSQQTRFLGDLVVTLLEDTERAESS